MLPVYILCVHVGACKSWMCEAHHTSVLSGNLCRAESGMFFLSFHSNCAAPGRGVRPPAPDWETFSSVLPKQSPANAPPPSPWWVASQPTRCSHDFRLSKNLESSEKFIHTGTQKQKDPLRPIPSRHLQHWGLQMSSASLQSSDVPGCVLTAMGKWAGKKESFQTSVQTETSDKSTRTETQCVSIGPDLPNHWQTSTIWM